MKIRQSKHLLAAATASSALLLPLTASAQDDVGLEEILVTAQKRAENLQETPIAITALSGDQLEQLGRADVSAIATQTPSLSYSEAGGEAQIYIRGVGSNLFTVGADPSVALHLDGVYLGRSNMGLTQFLDVESVEVLRGPQGTLYGRNATGGAINIKSKMPTDQNEGYISGGVGSFSRKEARGAINFAGDGPWALRFAGRYSQDDGFTDDLNPAGGDKIDDNDLWALRSIVQFRGDSLTATLIGDYSEFVSGNTSIRPIDNIGAARALGAAATSDFHATRNNTPSFFDWQTGGITLNVRWDINDELTLTSVSGYRAWDSDFLFNTDGTEIEVTRTTQVYDTRQWSQEFQLTGKHERLNWIAGLYYLKEEKFGALGLVRLNPATPFSFNIFDDNTGKAWAAFGQLDFELTDRLTLIAGLRYSDEEKDDFNRQYQVLQSATNPRGQIELGLFGGLTLPATTLGAPRDRSDSWDATTPKVGLQFQATDDAMLYATWSKGFKSGGYNGFQPNNPVYDPEFIKSIEIGAKTEWLDGRLRLNAAIFDYDYEDLQVSAFLNSLTVTSNAADSTVRGAELDLTWKPNSQLQLGASLAFLDATYDEYAATYGICTLVAINSGDAPCAGVAPMSPAAARVIDASGNRLNNAPKFKGLLSADYEIPLPGGGKMTLFGALSHTDDIFFNAANDPVASQAAYTVLDARVAWSNADETIELAIYGKNLGDEDYFHNIVQFTSTSLPPAANALPAPGQVITDPLSIGHALGYPAPGRQFGVDFTYRFGNR